MTRRTLYACLLTSVLTFASIPALADRDAVSFGSDIDIPAGHSVHDAVCFFCSVHSQGSVDGDIVVFFGEVHIAGAAHHDVVNFFGSVRADNDSTIDHDLVSFFGGIHLGDNVAVGHDMVAMFGSVHAASSVSVGGDRVTPPFWLFMAPIVMLFLLISFVTNEVRSHRRRQFMAAYPMQPPPSMPPHL